MKKHELYHHGILGQRWGHKNGPPYPLDADRHSSSEIEAHYKRSLGKSTVRRKNTNTEGTLLNDARRFSNPVDAQIQEVTAFTRQDGTVAYPPIATIIRAYETSEIDTNTHTRTQADKPFQKENWNGFEGVYDSVNPDYGQPGTTNNCPFCAAAIQIEGQYGYDICARRSLGGASSGMFTRWFKGAQNEVCQNWDELKQDILSDGDSSGVIQGYYGAGLGSGQGGHSLHYRNEGGKITIADGQNHTEHDFDDVVKDYNFNPGKNIRTRLDNCEPDWTALAEDGVLGVEDSEKRRWRKKNDSSTIYDSF